MLATSSKAGLVLLKILWRILGCVHWYLNICWIGRSTYWHKSQRGVFCLWLVSRGPDVQNAFAGVLHRAPSWEGELLYHRVCTSPQNAGSALLTFFSLLWVLILRLHNVLVVFNMRAHSYPVKISLLQAILPRNCNFRQFLGNHLAHERLTAVLRAVWNTISWCSSSI